MQKNVEDVDNVDNERPTGKRRWQHRLVLTVATGNYPHLKMKYPQVLKTVRHHFPVDSVDI